jgi:hypothetical protein
METPHRDSVRAVGDAGNVGPKQSSAVKPIAGRPNNWNPNMQHNKRSSISDMIRVTIGGAFVVLGTQAIAQERPAVTIRQGSLVQPETAVYGSATSRTYGIPSLQAEFNAGTRSLEVRMLAKGLGADTVAHGPLGVGQISEQE